MTKSEIRFDEEVRNRFVKTPIWNKEKEQYICLHCENIITASNMAYEYNCRTCGLPIHKL